MAYQTHTEKTIKEMLNDMGLSSIEDLYSYISDEIKLKKELDIPSSHSELELQNKIYKQAAKNASYNDKIGFQGAGIYDHFIPSLIDYIIGRGEFLTAYTPYQAEASQGGLQAMFEYQTAMSRLCGLDISNSSLYDGGSAVAEAILLAANQTRRKKILISEAIHPEYTEVVRTYLNGMNYNIEIVKVKDFKTDYNQIKNSIDKDLAAVVIQTPNFYGAIEDFEPWNKEIIDNKSVIIGVSYPIALGMIKSPADFGAQIVVGEGQSLGNYMGYGGPHFGFMACQKDFIRRIPGRIVGKTLDADGNQGYCLTFQTREQHIRREKATSNICTNQALCALRAIIYLSIAGEKGLKEVAEQCYHKAHYLKNELEKIDKIKIASDDAFFNEFVIEVPMKAETVNQKLFDKDIIGGIELCRFNNDLSENLLMIAVTEKRTKEELDTFIIELKKII